MSKMKKKFIAMLVVFMSIISFFSTGFSGLMASAATTTTDPTSIFVYLGGSTNELTAKTIDSETVYSTANYADNGFDIVMSNLVVDLQAQADKNKLTGSGSVSGIVDQELEIVSINGTSNATTDGKAILNELGIGITDSTDPNSSRNTIGKNLQGLPLGVDKIVYRIKVTTQTIDYTAATTDSSGNAVPATTTAHDKVVKTYSDQPITIYHDTSYVTQKLSSMLFKAYLGSSSNFDSETDEVLDDDLRENNGVPLLYTRDVEPDSDIALKYTFNVPDSTTSLKYVMTFANTVPLEGAYVYKNGVKATEGTDYEISGKTLTGNLYSLDTSSDLIVIKLNSTSSSTNIAKSYAIQIKYSKLASSEDYSIVDAGITKLNYDDDTTVKAYIGKKFSITTDSSGVLTYTGTINIDKKATMVSLDPTFIANQSEDNLAYILTNHYMDSGGTTTVQNSVLKNGKQYIDFTKGSASNTLYLNIYAGSNGNVTDSTTILARYIFNVNLITTDTFSLDLAFTNSSGSSDEAYLTQPGVKANTIDFSTSRRTYDLYSSDPVTVSFALKSENDTYTGIRSSKNEYIKVWLADSVNSNNLTEAEASTNNKLDSDYTRATSLSVNLNGAQKMVVQAYYDDSFSTSSDGTITCVSHSIGDTYVFYLPNNYDNSGNTGGDTSSDALLNYLNVKDATLTDSDGNEGFSSDMYEYTTTVSKDATTAKITATAEDDNVDSIVETIEETGASDALSSGVASNITLDTSGTTTVNIVVTAQDGTTTKKYTVVIKNSTKSSTTTLSNVILNTGVYTFDSSEDTTTVHVSQNTTSIKVTPVPSDSGATVTVNSTEYTSSAITVSLKGAQETDIDIIVKSEDGTASKTYTLKVYRTDSTSWNDDSSSDSNEDDQYYDEYNSCWVDTTKYEEWGTVNGKAVYFDKNNRQVKDAWISTGGKYYYLNSSGYRASGWKVDSTTSQTYYLDPSTGEMRKGWMNLNNKWYYMGLNGIMKIGWLSSNGKWYYFAPNGQMVVNQSMYIDGKTYNFAQDGASL